MELPNLQVRLLQDTGKLPAGIVIEFPRNFATSLIHRRLAVPVGYVNTFPDLAIDEDDLEHVGFELSADDIRLHQ